jgi:HEAT repeat protein
MGRSANERWIPQVKRMLDNPSPTIRLEAVRAAGELEDKSSFPRLMDMINDDDDEEICLAAIWSLSQIGGEGVRELLEKAYEDSADDEIRDFIESALDNLAFTEDLDLFSLMDLPGIDAEELEDWEEGDNFEFDDDED